MTIEKGYTGIIGREDIKKRLRNAAAKDRAAHAYIFSGEAGTGKKYIAKLFAMALQCEAGGEEPCMECKSCRMALAGNHPDILFVSHEKPASVGVDEIREQVVEDADIRPYCSKKKIYIVPDASKMTVQAQNALLKTLEEPPAYCHIMLIADNTDVLLPTIRSRCVEMNIHPATEEETRSYLIGEMLLPDHEAQMLAVFSQGNIGKARKLANSGDFQEKLMQSVRFLKNSRDMDTISRLEFDKKIAADKQGIYDYLELFSIWFRDVLYFKASNDPERIIFREELKAIRQRAAVSSYEGLMIIINAIENARTRLNANVNPELVLELLFLTMWEN